MKKYLRGFTLVELMIVMAVIAVLATMALFGLNRAQASARDVTRMQTMNGVRTALERYMGDNGSYPASADFCTLVAALVTAGHLGAEPGDPLVSSGDICTGTAPLSANPAPTGGISTVQYTYARTAATTYNLTLDKEVGSTTFTEPK